MKHRTNVLHLSHTDVRYDARILKELHALAAMESLRVEAIGADRSEGRSLAQSTGDFEVFTLPVRPWAWLGPLRPIRLFLQFCELVLRMLPTAAARRPMIVHCHDTLVLPIGLLTKAFTGCRVVYDAHELESAKGGQSRLLSLATLAFERVCWRSIDLLICVSPSILRWYEHRLGSKRAILVLNTPPSPGPLPPSPKHDRYFHRTFGIPADRKVFLFVGIMGKARAIPMLLEVFRRASVRSHIVFMGYRDTVGVAAAAQRNSKIHLHPPVPHTEVVRLSREADCGLCLREDISLSDRYSLPNKLFEYAFAGVPILASRTPEIERVVLQHRLGICCDTDTASIEAAVLRIEREGIEARPQDLTELTWETQAYRLQEAYRALLSEVGAAA